MPCGDRRNSSLQLRQAMWNVESKRPRCWRDIDCGRTRRSISMRSDTLPENAAPLVRRSLEAPLPAPAPLRWFWALRSQQARILTHRQPRGDAGRGQGQVSRRAGSSGRRGPRSKASQPSKYRPILQLSRTGSIRRSPQVGDPPTRGSGHRDGIWEHAATSVVTEQRKRKR